MDFKKIIEHNKLFYSLYKKSEKVEITREFAIFNNKSLESV